MSCRFAAFVNCLQSKSVYILVNKDSPIVLDATVCCMDTDAAYEEENEESQRAKVPPNTSPNTVRRGERPLLSQRGEAAGTCE